jgi:transcription elongation factor GreB
MSKAFTRESDDARPEEIASTRPNLPPAVRNYITHQGAERLKQQLDRLIEKKAASNDPSGSGPGTRQDAEIRKLQQLVSSFVIAEVPNDQDKIAFGAEVVLRRGNGEVETYRIVGVEEAVPEEGAISWVSPLARALLSHKAGDKISFRAPVGEEELTIISLHYQAHKS